METKTTIPDTRRILLFLASPCPFSITWVPWVLCIGGFILSMLLFYPGWVHALFYSQALSGVYTDPHPPIFAATWFFLRSVQNALGIEGTGQGLFYTMQTCILWGGIFMLFKKGIAFGNRKKSFPLWILILICPFLFVICFDILYFSRLLGKNPLMLSCWLLATGCLLYMPTKILFRLIVGGIVLCLLFLGYSLRYNLILAVLPLLFWFVWHFLPIRFRNFSTIVPCGFVLWGLFCVCNHHINYNILRAYRLYAMHEMFYQDIFILNYFAPQNYKNPPNTFGNNFDNLTPDLFLTHYDQRHLFQQHAFKTIAIVLQQEFSLWKEFIQITPTEDMQRAGDNCYVHMSDPPKKISYNIPLRMIDECEVREQYPKDYVLLREAWIQRIKQDPLVYLLHKTRIWLHFMNCNFDRNSLLLSAWMGGLTVFFLVVPLCFQVFSSNRWSPETMPSLMLASSAVLTVLPMIIFLPDNRILYLYWFYAASFVAIAHFCSQSVLVHEIVTTIQQYLVTRAVRQSPASKYRIGFT